MLNHNEFFVQAATRTSGRAASRGEPRRRRPPPHPRLFHTGYSYLSSLTLFAMAGLNVFVSVCWVALVAAQIKFPNDKDPSQATSNPDAPQQDAPPANPGQTRFAGLGSLDLDPLGLFSDQCDRCATNQQLAFRCCQSKNRCCSIFRPVAPVGPPFQTFTGHIPGQVGGHFPGQVGGHFPGQVGGHFPGQVGGHFPGQVGGHFPGQVGPPGHLGGVGGGKGGQCPVVAGVHTGLHRFSSGACVAECKNDFFCPGIQKCCSVGCSTVCRTPHGVPTSPVVVQPTYKPGRCPHKGFLGLLGLRSASNVPQADPGVDPDTLAHQEEQQTNKERRLTRKERREERRQFRDRREASEGPWSPRVRRSAHHKVDRNDNRERRLKRLFRKNGRVIRSAELLSRVTRQAGSDPNQRFFLGNLFCKSDCFSDFDCPGNLKCCSESKDCLKCINPAF